MLTEPVPHAAATPPPSLAGGGYCGVASSKAYLTCRNSSQDAAHPDAQLAIFSRGLAAGLVLTPNTTVLVKSLKTGMFCRFVKAPSCPTHQVMCDVPPEEASPFDYNVTAGVPSLGYKGQKLFSDGSMPAQLGAGSKTGPQTELEIAPGEARWPDGGFAAAALVSLSAQARCGCRAPASASCSWRRPQQCGKL